MRESVLVAASPVVVDAVRRALPEFDVEPAERAWREHVVPRTACLFLGPETGYSEDNAKVRTVNVPVVRLLADGSAAPDALDLREIPSAHVGNAFEIRLALRSALLQHRTERSLAEVSGPWSHDARGALGVVRLALELLKASGDQAASMQKIENGATRLGWLVERLPAQIALAIDLPTPERPPATLFPSLQAYVAHLVLVHSRRPIELDPGEWAASAASLPLVPYAAGFAELALRVSPAKARIRFSASADDGVEVDCECPARPEPWNIDKTFDALEVSRAGDAFGPYRLTEAARLAVRDSARFSVTFNDRGFVAHAQTSPRST